MMQVGNNSGYASVPLLAITSRELSLKGSFRVRPITVFYDEGKD